MRKNPLPHEIESYQANGFIMIPNFLDDDELAHWRKMADAEVAKAPVTARASTGQGVYSIRTAGMARRDPEWKALLTDARLGEFAARLEGLSSVRYAGDQISFSEPNCPPTPWHCVLHEVDIPFDTRQTISVQMQLDDNTVQNKAMLFLPGTHKTAPRERRFASSPASDPTRTFESLFERSPEWLDIDPVAAEGPAGSALFWNIITVHGSGSNMTRKTRRYVGAHWIPADAAWNGALGGIGNVTEEMTRGKSPGDVLDVPELPVVWSA